MACEGRGHCRDRFWFTLVRGAQRVTPGGTLLGSASLHRPDLPSPGTPGRKWDLTESQAMLTICRCLVLPWDGLSAESSRKTCPPPSALPSSSILGPWEGEELAWELKCGGCLEHGASVTQGGQGQPRKTRLGQAGPGSAKAYSDCNIVTHDYTSSRNSWP